MTVAQLGIEVQSGQAASAVVNLDALAASAGRAEVATTRLGTGATSALKNTAFQTANVTAQFQDIAVQLAAGQSPFLIALQQGTQLSSALGEGRGLKGALSGVAAGLASLVSPVSLATIGIIALGGLGVQAITAMLPKVKSLDDLLSEHKTIVADIRKSWDEASKGLDDYDRKSQALIAAQARENAALLAAQLRQQTSHVLEGGAIGIELPTDVPEDLRYLINKQFEPFRAAILDLRQQAKAGKPDIDAFYAAIERQVSENPGLRAIADQLEIATADAEALARALGQAGDAATIAGDKYALAMSDFDKLPSEATLLDQLRQLTPDLRTARQKAIDTYNQNSGLDVTGEGKAQLEFTLKQIAAQDAMQEAERRQREAASAAKAHADAVKTLTDSLDAQLAALTQTDREQFISEQLSRAKADAATEEGKKIAALAGTLYDQKEAAKSLKDTLDDLDDTGKSLTEGFFATFKRDLQQGVGLWQSFGDAASGVLDSLADKALKMAADGIWNAIFGAISGGLTGGLGGGTWGQFGGFAGFKGSFGIPGFASGTDFAPGGLALVGERGPELVNLPRGSQVMPNGMVPANSNAPAVSYSPTYNLPSGMTRQEALALMYEHDRSFLQSLPDRVAAIQRNPYRRTA